MKLLNWLDLLASPAPTLPASRRATLTWLGRRAALALPPLAVATQAAARPRSITTDSFNLLLRVLQLQEALYDGALGGSLGLSATERATATTLQAQIHAAASFLRTVISRSGDAPEAPRNYDLTGGGSGAHTGPLNPLTVAADFWQLAQGLADLQVRAALGQISIFAGSETYGQLTAQLLGTFSRVAALIRRQRQLAGAPQHAWITGTDLGGLNALFAPIYAGEDTQTQSGLPLTTTTGVSGRTAAIYAEAFDEPLTSRESTDPQLLGGVQKALLPFIYA